MLERFLHLAPLVSRVVLEIQRSRASKAKPPEIISAEDEETLREVKDLLAPLARATKELSSDKVVTLSKCIPVVRNLRKDIESYQPTTGVSYNLQQHLQTLIQGSFGSIEEVKSFAVATLLDPRFKKFGFYQDVRTPRRLANAISWASDLVKQKMRAAQVEIASASSASVEQPIEVTTGREDGFWGDFDREVAQQSAMHSGQDTAGGAPIQLRMFLDSPPVNRRENPDPLAAWDALKAEYKYVYQVAQEYESILATSVPSERLFSHAGFIAHQRRTRLASKRLDMLVFLRSCDEKLWFEAF